MLNSVKVFFTRMVLVSPKLSKFDKNLKAVILNFGLTVATKILSYRKNEKVFCDVY